MSTTSLCKQGVLDQEVPIQEEGLSRAWEITDCHKCHHSDPIFKVSKGAAAHFGDRFPFSDPLSAPEESAAIEALGGERTQGHHLSRTVLRVPDGPFHAPIALTFDPLIAALSAGNTPIVKHWRTTPNTSASIEELVALYFEREAMTVISGDRSMLDDLLSFPFDFLFFAAVPALGRLPAHRFNGLRLMSEIDPIPDVPPISLSLCAVFSVEQNPARIAPPRKRAFR